jgi:hypothetical protein
MTNLDYMYDTGSHDLFRSTEEEDISTLRDETQSAYALIMISDATYHGSEDIRLHVIGVGGYLKYNMRRLPYLFRSYLESFPSKRYIDSGPTPYGEET